MKFYRIDWPESEPSALQTDWAASKRAAAKLARESGSPDARVTEVEVPTDRAGLLAWLKKNIWCDAGRAIFAAQDR